MKSENIIEALNDIDHELLADAETKHKRSVKSLILKWGTVAACLCVIFAIIWGALTPEPLPPIPVYENAICSAAEIGEMMDQSTLGGTTNAYDTVTVSNPDELRIKPIPDSEYLDCWLYNDPDIGIDEGEFAAFLDAKMPTICAKLGIDEPSYEIFDMYSSYDVTIYKLGDGKYNFRSIQNYFQHYISIETAAKAAPESTIVLDGISIQFGINLTDEEIMNYLSDVKELFFEMFGVSFPDLKIMREYYADPDQIAVFFYNQTEHPLNDAYSMPVTDFILLTFKTSPDGTDMLCVDAFYRQYRSSADERYTFATLRRIPLEDAETLLYNGYVFGGHTCKLCMAAQEKISFRDYDYVGFYYYNGYPFYAFYKKIETDENGLQIYAKTYVPAFEVSGYEEYFESQKAEHPTQQ